MPLKNTSKRAKVGYISNKLETNTLKPLVFWGFLNYEVMKIMKIKIHNDIWKVEMVDADAKKMNPDEDHYNFGLTEYKELLISIMAGRCASVTRSTVIHELVHAFMFSYGHAVESEEAMCDFFGVHGDEIIYFADQIMKELM